MLSCVYYHNFIQLLAEPYTLQANKNVTNVMGHIKIGNLSMRHDDVWHLVTSIRACTENVRGLFTPWKQTDSLKKHALGSLIYLFLSVYRNIFKHLNDFQHIVVVDSGILTAQKKKDTFFVRTSTVQEHAKPHWILSKTKEKQLYRRPSVYLYWLTWFI